MHLRRKPCPPPFPSAKQQRKVAIFAVLKSRFRCSSRRSFLNCLKLYIYKFMIRKKNNNLRYFKKLRRLLEQKCHLKIKLCGRLSVSRLSYVDHVVQTRQAYLRLFGTNRFHVKAKNERITATGLPCRHNFKNENFTSLFDGLR